RHERAFGGGLVSGLSTFDLESDEVLRVGKGSCGQKGSEREARKSGHEKIQIIDYKPFTGLSKLPEILAKRIIKREWKRVFYMVGLEPDLIWSFDNSVLFDFSSISVFSIAHIVDLNQDFQFQSHAETADICFGSTPFVLEKLKKCNSNSHFQHHGCVPRTTEIQTSPTPIGMYIGNISISYLDRAFVKRLILRFPDIAFVFIGAKNTSNLSNSLDRESELFMNWLEDQPNVELTGSIEQADLDEQLKRADFYFLAYGTDHYEQVANPHKVMELLSTGKQVFSFPLECYKELNFPSTFENEEAYLKGIAKAKEHETPFENPYKKAQIDYALQHTYEEQIKRIEACLKSH
ncbi:MAG: hypothetical protein ACPGWM_10625, partial [Flavobacteriales bacterium]